MAEFLATKHRPSAFDQLIGQDFTALILSKMVETGKIPTGLLFSGPSGTGKTTAARILASALGSESSVIEVDAASNRGVDHTRQIAATLRFASPDGFRVIILDEAHNLTPQAFDALLKTLEDPPPNSVFILVTTEPDSIPDDAKSRLIEFEFRKVPSGIISAYLRHVSELESIPVDDDVLTHVASTSNGSVRRALMSLDKVSIAGISTYEDYQHSLRHVDFAPVLFEAMLSGNHAKVFAVLDDVSASIASPDHIVSELLSLMRDILILRSNGSLDASDGEAAVRKRLTYAVDRERIIVALRLLWDLRTKVRTTEDQRRNLDLVVILLTDVLARGRNQTEQTPSVDSKTEPEEVSSKKLTLSDMQRGA